MNSRYSEKREQILKLLNKIDFHPTADEIYTELKKEFSNLSLATVYRNLDTLCSKGIISKINFDTRQSRYEVNPKKHFHLTCRKCDKIYDVWFEKDASNYINLSKYNSKHLVTDYNIKFYGVCSDCRKKENGGLND